MSQTSREALYEDEGSQVKWYKQLCERYIFRAVNVVKYMPMKVSRTVSVRNTSGVVLPENVEVKVSLSGVEIYPEFVLYTFNLEGCARKLLMYLIFHMLDVKTGTFVCNARVIKEFIEYCDRVECKESSYQTQSVKIALGQLVSQNLAQEIKDTQYFLHPVLAGRGTKDHRAKLIKEYSRLTVDKRKNPITLFYPAMKGRQLR